jgi:HK97 family phage portal protein
MGILSRNLGINAWSLEDPAQPLLPPSALYETLGLGRSDAGVLVNDQQAMRIATALACIKIISEDLGTTSHEILQRMPDDSVRQATNHRLWPILHDEPNPHMSACVFWGALKASTLSSGNGYALIKRDGSRRAIALIPLKSSRTSPVRVEGKLMYATTQTDTGAVAYIDPADIIHDKYFSLDGIVGIGPVSCKNTFGLAGAAEKYGAQFFGNGARASGVLSHPGTLEEEAQTNLWKSLRERLNGDNALMPLILEEGMTWTQNSISPNEAQFLQTRQYQRVEIASLYRLAMHLLQDLQRATNNNIEHQSLDHVRYCLRPNAVHLEQEVNRKLLGGPFFMEHNLNDLQRGDFASQTTGLAALRNIGYYNDNDIARALRQNPIPASEGGDIRVIQGAFINLTSLLPGAGGDEGTSPDTDGAADGSQPFNRILPAYRVMVRDAVGRVLNRENPAREFVKSAFVPILKSMACGMSAYRFGSAELTKHDHFIIDAEAGGIADAAVAWQKKDAAAIATRVAGHAWELLAKEILS